MRHPQYEVVAEHFLDRSLLTLDIHARHSQHGSMTPAATKPQTRDCCAPAALGTGRSGNRYLTQVVRERVAFAELFTLLTGRLDLCPSGLREFLCNNIPWDGDTHRKAARSFDENANKERAFFSHDDDWRATQTS